MWRLLKLCIAFASVMFIGAIVVLATVRFASRDPLARYAALMPGQSIDGLRGYPCQFRAVEGKPTKIGYCHFNTDQGVLSEITLTIFRHVIVETTAFTTQPNALRIGDLIACWSTPTAIEPAYPVYADRFWNIYWNSQLRAQIKTAQYEAHPDYFTPITFLSISDPWKPCTS